MRQNVNGQATEFAIVSTKEILNARTVVGEIYMDEKSDLRSRYSFASRQPKITNWIRLRTSSNYELSCAHQSCACIKSVRIYQTQRLCYSRRCSRNCNGVLRHRIGLTYEAEAEREPAKALWKRF